MPSPICSIAPPDAPPSPGDPFGNAVSPGRPATLAAIDDFILGFLGYETRIVNILAAADADPGHCLANAYAGLLWMLSETGGTPDEARRFLARAQHAVPGALPRERAACAVLRLWIEDNVPGLQDEAETILAEHPRDLLMLKVHQYHGFNRGQFPQMLRIAMKVAHANQDVAYWHGMAAFGYEQCHLLDLAEDAARRAIALQRKEPWAQHALAHVMLTQGRIDEGALFMESVRDSWAGLTSFMYTHHWWHLALFYLSQGRFAEALAAYDDHCWSMQKDFSQDQIGAVSLLTRMEFAGIDVGRRWQELGGYLAVRASDVGQPFLSLQYLYGLARAGRPEATQLLAAIRHAAEAAPAYQRAVWQEVGVPIAEALLAHAEGAHDLVVRRLGGTIGRLGEIGGSHAQRDLFEQILLDSQIRGGHLDAAQQTLELRRHYDPDGVPLNRALAAVYEALDLPELADAAALRAATTAGRHTGLLS